ncbi:subclass B1 metallo-beta-lactamase [Hyphococcus sp. DH-69]|uniref:subclass B1 metallo-beta-lactamase n=1 Tax=Hyphococcus formosus TaxID=3143534 RepID=UPI00398B5BAE
MMIRALVFIALLGLTAACSKTTTTSTVTNEVPAPSLEQIAENVWIHKSYADFPPYGPVLSQGLVIKTDEGIVLVDTAWTNGDTAIVLDLIEDTLGDDPDMAVVTHAHADKMGGVDTLNKRGIGGRAHPLTNEDAPGRNLKPTQYTILEDRDIDTLMGWSENGVDHDGPITVYYPGPGHARDNIVVYHAPSKVLFVGCLIRPGTSNSLGNTADADLSQWAQSVRNVAATFPEAQIIVPSHSVAGDRALLDHTIALVEAANAE